MAISALNGDAIEKKSIVSMDDYLVSVPGVSYEDSGVGENAITMRGLTTAAFESAPVGVFIGEVPLNIFFGGVTGANTVDIKLVDMQRVEVLRGPQGTLFGSGTMAGAIRNIPNVPNLEELEGDIKLGLSNTDGAKGTNNKINGVINIPLIEEQLALRIAGYRFKNEGYTDLVGASEPTSGKAANAATYGAMLRDEKGVGSTVYTGYRASLLWKPSDELAVALIQITQDSEQDGYPHSLVAKDGYKNISFDPNSAFGEGEGRSEDVNITNLVVEYDLGWGSLLSSTAFKKYSWTRIIDLGRFNDLPLPQQVNGDTDSFIQELRISSQFDGPFQFLAGLYYEDEENILDGEVRWSGDLAIEPFPIFLGGNSNNILFLDIEQNLQQKAFFGEVSYMFNDELTLTVGGRWFDYEKDKIEASGGAFAPPPLDRKINEDGFKGKVNISYTPSDDTLIYAQWAQGFRLGRPAFVPPALLCDTNNDGVLDGTNSAISTDDLTSDTTDSVELGGKFGLLENRLTLNTAIYRVEWTDIPISVLGSCGFSSALNAGEATSQGIEVEATYYVLDDLRIEFGASYIDAELTKNSEGVGSKGDRLPLSPRSNVALAFEYGFEMAGYRSFVRADYASIGGYFPTLQGASAAGTLGDEIGDYDKLSLRAGITVNQLDVAIYGTNLTQSDEFVFATGPGGIRVAPSQIGLDLHYRF